MICVNAIREKRGIQWDRDQIMVRSKLFFYTPTRLYSDLKNIAVLNVGAKVISDQGPLQVTNKRYRCSLVRWHFHLPGREEVSLEVQPR
jgi:hypothetical protein